MTNQPQDDDQRKSSKPEPDICIRLIAVELAWNSKEVDDNYKPLVETLKIVLQENFKSKSQRVRIQQPKARAEVLEKPPWKIEEDEAASQNQAPGDPNREDDLK
jgi:hypothetical protein